MSQHFVEPGSSQGMDRHSCTPLWRTQNGKRWSAGLVS